MVGTLDATLVGALPIPWWALVIGAYLCGSIPFGLLLGRMKGVDIREHGSRNIGATNVGRVLGTRLGLLCFALDAGKGAAPVIVAGVVRQTWGVDPVALSQPDAWWWLMVAVAALIGHMASPWLHFRGGKGVATGFGAMVALWQPLTLPTLAAFVVWLVVVRLTRYVSLASISAAAALPLATLAMALWHGGLAAEKAAEGLRAFAAPLTLTTLLGGVVILKHRTNIVRLWRGEELKIGSARSQLDPRATIPSPHACDDDRAGT